MNEVPPINSGISKRTKRIILGIVIAIICIPIVLFLIFFIDFCYIEPSRILHEADAGFRKAKATIDPEQLRLWAFQEISKYPYQINNPPQIPNSEIPSYLQKLYPNPRIPAKAFVEESGNQKYMDVYWGGGLFSWGFEVGQTNFVPPADSYLTRAKWVSGIYYNREDTVHPIK
ncbi:MAG TPA: hypothetical protein VGM58_11080 [Verrucomicrobiae bacterium]|jgi:hypothetical protein